MDRLSKTVAVVNPDKCQPDSCHRECIKKTRARYPPRGSVACISIERIGDKQQTTVNDSCVGCGSCVKICPFSAIELVQLPSKYDSELVFSYGRNLFRLFRLPVLRQGSILGVLGQNGTGKTTALRIISGSLRPNFGRTNDPPEWPEIIHFFRRSLMREIFENLSSCSMKAVIKPQYIHRIQKVVHGQVGEVIAKKDQTGRSAEFIQLCNISHLLEREIDALSGGELERFAICIACIQQSDIYLFDEPSSFLDIKQRLDTSKAIRSLLQEDKCIAVVEHDLIQLDFLSDFICIMYGVSGGLGIVSASFDAPTGINTFLKGVIPTENVKFRNYEITFQARQWQSDPRFEVLSYPSMTKTYPGFTLQVEPGQYQPRQIIVILGENGCGKTTFMRLLAGNLEPDNHESIPRLSVSVKPQVIAPTFKGTVEQLLRKKDTHLFYGGDFRTDVYEALGIPELLSKKVKDLSGGERQRLGIVLALSKDADLYLIDEPSVYLDSEYRLLAANALKKHITKRNKTAFVVEHDLIMASYIADRVIVYEGQPGVHCVASQPEPLEVGLNRLLSHLNITMRRDASSYRPRVNKLNSLKDREQRAAGVYFSFDP